MKEEVLKFSLQYFVVKEMGIIC